jgi:hypothetical protein
MEKTADPEDHHPNSMMLAVLRETIKRMDQHCVANDSGFIVFLDDRDDKPLRDAVVTVTQQEMYGQQPKLTLLEAPTEVESHRYQLLQASDWICGLLGRIEAYRCRPDEYSDFSWTQTYFTDRVNRVSCRSGVRKQSRQLSVAWSGSSIAATTR